MYETITDRELHYIKLIDMRAACPDPHRRSLLQGAMHKCMAMPLQSRMSFSSIVQGKTRAPCRMTVACVTALVAPKCAPL